MMITFELAIGIIINLIVLAFFVGLYVCTIKNHGRMIDDIKETVSREVAILKLDFKEHLNRVEQKQDKHNNLIERMVRVEDSCKSAHKRMDELDEIQHECFFKRNSK